MNWFTLQLWVLEHQMILLEDANEKKKLKSIHDLQVLCAVMTRQQASDLSKPLQRWSNFFSLCIYMGEWDEMLPTAGSLRVHDLY